MWSSSLVRTVSSIHTSRAFSNLNRSFCTKVPKEVQSVTKNTLDSQHVEYLINFVSIHSALNAQKPKNIIKSDPKSITSTSHVSSFSSQPIWLSKFKSFIQSSPIDARSSYEQTIHNAIAAKYGVYSSAILAGLSAIVVDSVFWWLTALLLDDGM